MAAFRNPRRTFVAGVLVVLPILITWWFLSFLFQALDGPVAGLIETLVGRRLPGLGLLLMLTIIFVVGMLASNIMGARLVQGFERLLLKVPLVGSVFGPAKQLFMALGQDDRGDQEVVALEFPRKGLYMVGFVTRRDPGSVSVFLPTTPNPTSGFLVICPPTEVVTLGISFDVAMQYIVSGGIVSPLPSPPWSAPAAAVIPGTAPPQPGDKMPESCSEASADPRSSSSS